jgi:hypothetical protein
VGKDKKERRSVPTPDLSETDRLGNVYRQRFEVNTDLWAYPSER